MIYKIRFSGTIRLEGHNVAEVTRQLNALLSEFVEREGDYTVNSVLELKPKEQWHVDTKRGRVVKADGSIPSREEIEQHEAEASVGDCGREAGR